MSCQINKTGGLLAPAACGVSLPSPRNTNHVYLNPRNCVRQLHAALFYASKNTLQGFYIAENYACAGKPMDLGGVQEQV